MKRLALGLLTGLAVLGCDKTAVVPAEPPPQAGAPEPGASEVGTPVAGEDKGPASGTPAARPDADPDPKPPGGDCDGEACTKPRTCVRYYGIAGSQGPQFASCEIRCKPGSSGGCPDGLSCVTIADGPGSVCR
ncbi:MAG: hypothetical protein JKY37_24620 [Nannocystaceae bacterium]|nr:hypothetical protein [Nannocystaceae bacterium]